MLVGLGAVGVRVARHLLAQSAVEVESVVVLARDAGAVARTEGMGSAVSVRAGRGARIPDGTDVVVISRADDAATLAADALRAGAHVVAAMDDPHQVRHLLGLDRTARAGGHCVAVGTTMAPGLSCVLARYGATQLDDVREIHVASYGTGGPACARRHHAALSSIATDWYDGAWRRRQGGTGRELMWFPEPVGAADCYRARLVDPVLLAPAFPGVRRVSARMAATRRDRLTAPLPMLRPPHPEGLLGATRVELRGTRDGAQESLVYGSVGRPALVAGAVAGVAAVWAATGQLARAGAGGLGEMVDRPGAFLREVAQRGITLSAFEGEGSEADGLA
ncbi:MAG: saccharopine dehydrogenase family protein [Acidimicrobiales bacterium]